jgi:nucleotide-binding universal stress UspA family protein
LLVKNQVSIGDCLLLLVNAYVLYVVFQPNKQLIINTQNRCHQRWISMLYEKILVPIDNSAHSIHALQEAIKIVKAAGGEITVAYVCNETSEGPSFVMPQLSQGCDDKSVFAQSKKVADDAGVPVEFLRLEGNVADQIVKAATDGCFDLIVIGARGLGNLSGIVLGSVSQSVIKHAPCPVLVTH